MYIPCTDERAHWFAKYMWNLFKKSLCQKNAFNKILYVPLFIVEKQLWGLLICKNEWQTLASNWVMLMTHLSIGSKIRALEEVVVSQSLNNLIDFFKNFIMTSTGSKLTKFLEIVANKLQNMQCFAYWASMILHLALNAQLVFIIEAIVKAIHGVSELS